MTIHEAADDLARTWHESRLEWRRELGLAEESTPIWKAVQRLSLAVDEYDRHQPGRRIEYDNLADLRLAEIVVRTDGGPWAVHNQPCAVCGERAAVLDLNEGVMLPCGPCQSQGWTLVKKTPPLLRWHRRLRRRWAQW